ncbi:MAG TPA: GNAT family N-acetyltransferase [Anaerolineae bacterium]|nr:GNAT family N-acetyltransferase [Anaerolineae bacterium]
MNNGNSCRAREYNIETESLTISSFRKSDIPEYAAIVADSEVTKFLGAGSPHSYEQATAYILDCIGSEAEEGLARYAVIHKETGELIGFCGFKKASDYIDLGWRYARRVWGSGYATEAAVAVLDYGISTLKLSGIVAESAVENIGSVRVIEGIGMQFQAFEVRGRKTVRYRQPNEPIAGADTAVAAMKP